MVYVEACRAWEWVSDLCSDLGLDFQWVDPGKMPEIRRSSKKTDRHDVEAMVSRLLVSGELPESCHECAFHDAFNVNEDTPSWTLLANQLSIPSRRRRCSFYDKCRRSVLVVVFGGDPVGGAGRVGDADFVEVAVEIITRLSYS